MTIDKIKSNKILITLCDEEMRDFSLDYDTLSLYDSHSRKILMRILQIACFKTDIEIKDNGKGYDVESIATPDLTQPKENGLGLFIIQTLMDDVKIESKDNQGTIIKMTKYLGVDI